MIGTSRRRSFVVVMFRKNYKVYMINRNSDKCGHKKAQSGFALKVDLRFFGPNDFLCKGAQGYWLRKSSISLRSCSSLMRVKRRVPSFLMVAGLSKGKLSYIFPPLKWHGMHFD